MALVGRPDSKLWLCAVEGVGRKLKVAADWKWEIYVVFITMSTYIVGTNQFCYVILYITNKKNPDDVFLFRFIMSIIAVHCRLGFQRNLNTYQK